MMGLVLKNKDSGETKLGEDIKVSDIVLLYHYTDSPLLATPAIGIEGGDVVWLYTGRPLLFAKSEYRVVRILQPGELLEVV